MALPYRNQTKTTPAVLPISGTYTPLLKTFTCESYSSPIFTFILSITESNASSPR